MTINLANNNPRIEYSVAQGATQQTFAVPFEFFNDSDITVYVDGVLKAEGTDYTLTGGDGSTGNVVFVTATPPAVQQVLGATGGSTVVIFRTTDIERTSDFSAGSDIYRAALNEQLDILTAMIADQNDKTDRTIRLNDYEIAPSLILPSIANRKGKVLAFNATTGAVEEGPTTDSIINVNAYVATASAAATSASASAASAAASFDSFDDRYLGSKTSDPTLDNDGNALLTGALYYDSVNLLMKVYTGSVWSSLLTGGSSITANSSTPALTINQTGAGAALLVEDETSPDSTPFVVGATGSVGIGTSTLTGLLNLYAATNSVLYVSGDTATSIVLSRSSSDATAANLNFRKYRGTTAIPDAVVSGDVLGMSNYTAWDGTALRITADIKGIADTFTGTNDVSGVLTFSTRPSGVGGALTERFRIASAGQIGIGGANYGTSGQTIVSGGSAAAPAWGTLPVSGGGTGVITSTGTGSNVLSGSPALTGTPTAPTAAAGTNTTQLATTAFVLANSGGMTLLGTLNTTSGTAHSLTNIAAGYRKLYAELDGVSGTGTGIALSVALSSTNGAGYGGVYTLASLAAANTLDGWIEIGNVSSTIAIAKNIIRALQTAGISVSIASSLLPTNTAAVVNAIQFSMAPNAFDAGTIRIFGVK
jgi:hypothetical protein